MSNPAVITLVDGVLKDGSHFRIEDNLGESIHIHLNKITFYLSITEFENLFESFYVAAKELLSNQGIRIDALDLSSLDWDWLRKYDQITSINLREKKISGLFTIEKVTKNGVDSWRYVPIVYSKNYRALCGEKDVLSQYKEFNLYGQDSTSRLNDIVELLKQKGYPFDDKYIIVNQHGVIIDGAHRAAALAYLYDESIAIPVIEYTFQNDLPVAVYNKNEKKRFWEKRIRSIIRGIIHLVHNVLIKIKRGFSLFNKKCATDKATNPQKLRSFDDFEKQLVLSPIRCFIIKKPKINCQGVKIADSVLIVDSAQLTAFKDYMASKGFWAQNKCYYDSFEKLYNLEKPYLYRLEDKEILVFDKLACKSLDFDALIPVDSSIVSDCWKTIVMTSNTLPEADCTITMLLIILDALLEQRAFNEFDKEFIVHHKDELITDRMRWLLDKEFFSFADSLIKLLYDEKFDEAIKQYLLFGDY